MAYGGELCDPLPLMRPGVRRHDGHPMPLEKAVWRWPSKRPGAVTCRARRPYTGEASPARDVDSEADAGAAKGSEAKP